VNVRAALRAVKMVEMKAEQWDFLLAVPISIANEMYQ